MADYCNSRFNATRRLTREVFVGNVGVGGDNPIRVQSMTTTPTQDIEATVKQTIDLVEAGCEIVRITAQNLMAAQALKAISKKLRQSKIDVPLVADIHFLPRAAMEAAEHVEKVRVNPGNYADKKKFAIREYTDVQYNEELQRLHDGFSPLVKKCKALGRSLRIGTNHGSLSDRIMNRYGDTPLGMVESALEFIRIAESHGFQDIILSMKASNPKVMIQAYRLVVAKMNAEGMNYPLHLGVTEAGDGEDARIKSSIGIGSLLYDGLGDTIRVSLTEDPVYEVPVAQALAGKSMQLWNQETASDDDGTDLDSINPFEYTRRAVTTIELNKSCAIATDQPPRIIIPSHHPIAKAEAIVNEVSQAQALLKDTKIEGLLLTVEDCDDIPSLLSIQSSLQKSIPFYVVECGDSLEFSHLEKIIWPADSQWMLLRKFKSDDKELLDRYLDFAHRNGHFLALDISPQALPEMEDLLQTHSNANLVFTLSHPPETTHPLGAYRKVASILKRLNISAPLWIRNTECNTIDLKDYFGDRLLEAATFSGSLLCDGLGDLISIETEPDIRRATTLAYNILQGARARISKTEFVACPSCGRTLFDLQSTTQQIRSRTDHLKGITIAVMGCIVNGPGEMADADFGYVGGAPGKINLYVAKNCVEYHIDEEHAVDKLIELIKAQGKWTEPDVAKKETAIA